MAGAVGYKGAYRGGGGGGGYKGGGGGCKGGGKLTITTMATTIIVTAYSRMAYGFRFMVPVTPLMATIVRLRRQAIITGSPYWWDRYNACVGYDYY